MLEIVSVLLKLSRLVLCPSVWSVLEKALCALERVFCIFGWNILSISVKSGCSVVSFWISVALLTSCLALSIDARWAGESSAVVPHEVSHFMSVAFVLCTLGALVWVHIC